MPHGENRKAILMFGRAPQGPYEGGEVSVNNNTNRSPVVGEYMNSTTHKTEERRFQEERRDVMKMDRFFTGLVALVAGLALSAGSALATKGYIMGDAAPMKLVPHYEVGDTKATVIGVQNVMSGDNDNMECLAAVGATPALIANAPDACKVDFDKDERTPPTLPDATNPVSIRGGGTVTPAQQLAMANVQANMDDAKNLIVTAIAYGPSGTEQASAEICLAPGAFGYVVIGKMDMDMDMMANGAMLSMKDGIGVDGTMTSTDDAGRTITEPMPAYNGYVTLTASHRVQFCDGRKTPSDEAVKVRTVSDPPYMDADGAAVAVDTNASRARYIANPAIAAWTIVQDIGDGFFGVEVPTTTVSMMRGEGMTIMAASQDLDCYDTDVDDAGAIESIATDGTVTPRSGTRNDPEDSEFSMMKCGLIPERHNNDRVSAGEGLPGQDLYAAGDPDTRTDATDAATDPTIDDAADGHATPRAKVTVRYDADDVTTVFVWLGAKNTELDIGVRCEEGMAAAIDDPSTDTASMLPMATVMVPGMTKMIDPSMGEVGSFVEQCMGGRGVLEITMPDGSGAGMIWSHVTQMGGHYRMNFPSYSMASDVSCRAMVVSDAATEDNAEKKRIDICM